MSLDYNYNDPSDIILLPFTENFNATNGIAPSLIGTNCQIVINEKPNGAKASLFCPNGISIKYSDLPIDFDKEQDFTIDFYMRYQSSWSGIASATIGSLYGFGMQADSVYYGNNRPSVITRTTGVIKNEWAHYALVRKDGITYWFVNGKLLTKIAITSVFAKFTNKSFSINARYTNGYNGGPAYYSHVRISNVARWFEEFEPPIIEEIEKPNPEPGIPEEKECCIPAGMVMYFAANAVPNGWLMCDGSEVLKNDYAKLYQTIGDIYGVINEEVESGTFKLPDLRGEFIRCFDAERGVDEGRVFGSHQMDALQDHIHGGVVATTSTFNANTQGARVADETRPRNVALIACIKY